MNIFWALDFVFDHFFTWYLNFDLILYFAGQIRYTREEFNVQRKAECE